MASVLYNAFKEALLNKEHDLSADTINVALISTSDEATVTQSDTSFTNIAGGPYGASTAAAITPVTITSGVFDSSGSPTFSSVAIDASKDVDVLILYNDTTTTPTADALICWIDGFTAVTPNGGDITITWGANIFSL